MSWTRVLAVAGAALLCVAVAGGGAVAAKKKRKGTAIVLNSGSPSVSKSGTIRVSGFLKTAPPCRPSRDMKLYATDANGAVLAILNSKSSDSNGNWRFTGSKLPVTTPNVTQYVQVKAIKKGVRNVFCRAGFTIPIPVSVPR